MLSRADVMLVMIGESLVKNWHHSIQSASSVSLKLHKNLGFSHIYTKWVRRTLTNDHTVRLKSKYFELFEFYNVNGDKLLSTIFACKETEHHFELEAKSSQWKASPAITTKKEIYDN